MGTRGAIARLTELGGFVGVYHHWDSAPAGLGQTLVELYHGHFGGDLSRMLAELIDEHPAGLSTIVSMDPNAPRGWYGSHGDAKGGWACYCHGERHQDPKTLTERNATRHGCEWVYAFEVDTHRMHVLCSYTPGGRKMIGVAGYGDPWAEWREVAVYDLREKPDLAKLQGLDSEGVLQ